MLVGHVIASDERHAMLVAQAICRAQGFRPPASVRPFIMADESILSMPAPVPVGPEPFPLPAPLASPVEATTTPQTLGGKIMDAIKGR